MKKTNSIFYNSAKYLYSIFPFQRTFCLFIKWLRVPNSLFYKYLTFQGLFQVKIKKGFVFKMYHHGGQIENETFWKGLFNTWESDTGWIWLQLCSISNVIFDVGANTGIYSLVAKSLNPTSKVYAFDPSKNTFDSLLYNNSTNKYDICCEQLAISNLDSVSTFYDVPNINQTSASLSSKMLKDADYYTGDVIEYQVNTITLSSYIQSKKLQAIDLIKIDIEMHEPEALEGLGKYLDEFKPIIIIEVLSEVVADSLNNQIGEDFNIFHLVGPSLAVQTNRFIKDNIHWNFLLFHKDLDEKFRKYTSLYQ